jgi:nitric oxide reductase subunit C
MFIGPVRYVILLTVFLGLFFLVLFYSISQVNWDSVPPEVHSGKRVFQRQACVECHSVFGNGGYNGGDLTSVYARLGEQNLKIYLTQPPLLSGAKKKTHPKITEQEAVQVIDYLRFVNSINTQGWPPASYK